MAYIFDCQETLGFYCLSDPAEERAGKDREAGGDTGCGDSAQFDEPDLEEVAGGCETGAVQRVLQAHLARLDRPDEDDSFPGGRDVRIRGTALYSSEGSV